MAKHFAVVVAVLVVAFCFSSASAAASTSESKFGFKNYFVVEGKIYCDPCRVEFETRLSRPLKVVMTHLECHKANNDKNITYRVATETDNNGYFFLTVNGERAGEICELRTDTSAHSQCNEPMKNNSYKLVITKDDGVTTEKHYVRSIGFMTPDIHPKCLEIYD
ncbi:hypothetical protein PIB30_055222 [Stylosanthes scabra]|uniref:Uncharacterized protein n=1 Tax=Stylosanthes scabra TaxID=79078 RepID=A0ABU6TL61_9FABA|nr:hypothetical protein [Stylosanthes scabra]